MDKQNLKSMNIKHGHKRTQSNSEFDFESLKAKPQQISNQKINPNKFYKGEKKNSNLTERLLQMQEKQQMKDNFKCIIIEEIDSICENKEDSFLHFGKKKNAMKIQQFEKIDENEEFNEISQNNSELNISNNQEKQLKKQHVKNKSEDYVDFGKININQFKEYLNNKNKDKKMINVQNYIQNYVKNYNQCFNFSKTMQNGFTPKVQTQNIKFSYIQNQIDKINENNQIINEQNNSMNAKLQNIILQQQNFIQQINQKLQIQQQQNKHQKFNLEERIKSIFYQIKSFETSNNQSGLIEVSDNQKKKKFKLKLNILSQIKSQKNSYLN